jgi:LysR family hydrogen peroxide-inducible transcriptional activator
MDLTQLRYLVTIAEAGSFTQAARKLKLSQPSLSLAIKKLEDEIGQPLFDRLTRRVVPTEAGERLLETARRVMEELDRTACEVRDLKGEVSGTLRIGAIPTIGPFVLPDILEQFHGKFPAVNLHVVEDVTGRLLPLLEQGELDVALVSDLPERPGIHTDLVGSEELLAIMPEDCELARQKTVEWQDLEKERFLVLGEEHCLAEQVAWFCRKNRISGRTIMEGTQLATIAALVQRGLGISLVPSLMVSNGHKKLTYRRLAGTPPVRPLYVAWSLLRYRTQAGREFTRMAHEVVADCLAKHSTLSA